MGEHPSIHPPPVSLTRVVHMAGTGCTCVRDEQSLDPPFTGSTKSHDFSAFRVFVVKQGATFPSQVVKNTD